MCLLLSFAFFVLLELSLAGLALFLWVMGRVALCGVM